jgi:hypothetical protein
MGGGGDLG